MAGLVADYDSDTESYDSGGSPRAKGETLLPKPKFETGCENTIKERSVFSNPFVEADKAEKAILEKHVKMISADVKIVNGKKICWNYRKNKCRFGHNCKYAHDSDLQIDKSINFPKEMKVKQVDVKNVEVKSVKESAVIKKRPGLAQDIIPPKKVLKFYNDQKRKKQKLSQ